MSDQSEDGATTTQESDQHRLAHDEEIRFAKKQQWTIATATVTLIAAIYAVAKNNDLTSREKIVFAVLVAIVGVFGCSFIAAYQRHLGSARLRTDPTDPDAFLRAWVFRMRL